MQVIFVMQDKCLFSDAKVFLNNLLLHRLFLDHDIMFYF